MGGKVLKLYSEELIERGMKQGIKRGRAEGRSQGIKLAKQVLLLHGEGKSAESIAAEVGISIKDVKEIIS